MKKEGWIAALSVCAIVAAGLVWWQRQGPRVPPSAPVESPSSALAEAPASAAASAVPAIRYPVVPSAPERAAAAPDLKTALLDLIGGGTAKSILQLDDFPRRLAATVDNLGRAQAPSRLWPIDPTPGRFMVERRDAGAVVSVGNAERYAPLLTLLEKIDLRRLHDVYAAHYPMFQQAYQDLGFPGGYFNDRVVEVIDLLLATPEVEGELKVHLPTINGPVQPDRPWVLFEFDDPALQALTSGQKILLRMGPMNQRRLKARLTDLRRLLVSGAPARSR